MFVEPITIKVKPIESWKNIGFDVYENEFLVDDPFSVLLEIYNAGLDDIEKITIYIRTDPNLIEVTKCDSNVMVLDNMRFQIVFKDDVHGGAGKLARGEAFNTRIVFRCKRPGVTLMKFAAEIETKENEGRKKILKESSQEFNIKIYAEKDVVKFIAGIDPQNFSISEKKMVFYKINLANFSNKQITNIKIRDVLDKNDIDTFYKIEALSLGNAKLSEFSNVLLRELYGKQIESIVIILRPLTVGQIMFKPKFEGFFDGRRKIEIVHDPIDLIVAPPDSFYNEIIRGYSLTFKNGIFRAISQSNEKKIISEHELKLLLPSEQIIFDHGLKLIEDDKMQLTFFIINNAPYNIYAKKITLRILQNGNRKEIPTEILIDKVIEKQKYLTIQRKLPRRKSAILPTLTLRIEDKQKSETRVYGPIILIK